MEQIYSINSPYLVAPFSFTRNVLQYQASQSRVCTDLNGKLGPCGSYDGFLEKLAVIRNNEGDYYDSIHNTHYQHLFGSLNEHISQIYDEQKCVSKMVNLMMKLKMVSA